MDEKVPRRKKWTALQSPYCNRPQHLDEIPPDDDLDEDERKQEGDQDD